MAKQEELQPQVDKQADKAGPKDKNDGPARVKKEWDEKHAGKGKQAISIPGSESAVSFTRMDVEGNKVSIWTSEDTTTAPQFVIVNPPTAVFIGKDNVIEDPLGAIAHIINGASN